jgi:hypothetical protein
MPDNGGTSQPFWQDVEESLQLCSRLVNILNVPKEGTPAVLASPAAALEALFSA